MPPTETVDGVYGATTRNAISAWQRLNNRPDAGFISDADALTLMAAQHTPRPPLRPPASPRLSFSLLRKAAQRALRTYKGKVAQASDRPTSCPIKTWQFDTGTQRESAAYSWRWAPCWGAFSIGSLAPLRHVLKPDAALTAWSCALESPGHMPTKSDIRRGRKLLFLGVTIALFGACITYGPTVVYSTLHTLFLKAIG